MAKFIPDVYLDQILTSIQEADEIVVLSAQPTSFINACWGALWQSTQAYSLGDIVRPTVNNGFMYVCTTAGTSGASQPGWTASEGATNTDGTVVWTAHANYSIASSSIGGGDFTVSNISGGKQLVTAQKTCTSHATGAVNHTALIRNADKTIRYCTTSTVSGSPTIDSGRTVVINSLTITRNNLQ